nr:hypothetical protein [Oscillochloris trichoides]
MKHLRACIGYLAASLLFFAVALPSMPHAFPGGPVAGIDGWQHVWHLWWTQHALATGSSPLFTDLLYYPSGVNLAIHPVNIASGIMVAPITALAGPVLAFNVALLLAFTLSGLGAYLLTQRVGVPPLIAFVAGLLFTFSPYHTTKAYDGQLEMASLQWLVLYAWLLLVALEERRAVWAVLAGIMLALVGYTSLYYLVYGAVYSLVAVLLWLPWRSGGKALLTSLLRLLLVPATAALTMAPLLLGLASTVIAMGRGGGDSSMLAELMIKRSANLLDFWLPSYLHPLWGAAVAQLGPILHPGISAWNNALGYTTLGLAIVGCVRAWPLARRWLVLALAGLVLALGPQLLVGPIQTGIPLPYRLLLLLPGMEIAQRPSHFVVLTSIALAPLAGLGLHHLVQRYGQRAIMLALTVAVIELAPPVWPTHTFSVNPVYADLAGKPGAILVLPIDIDVSSDLHDQITHQRPLVGGYLARIPSYPFAEFTPGLRQLRQLQSQPDNLLTPTSIPAVLDAFEVRDIIVHWTRIPPTQRADAEAALAQVLPGMAPTTYPDGTAVYHIPVGSRQPFAYFGDGWYPQEEANGLRWRWMRETGEILLMNPNPQPMAISLRLMAESHTNALAVNLSLNGSHIGQWDLALAQVRYPHNLHIMLAPGLNRLDLHAPTSPDPSGRGPISIVLMQATE